jgi:hypothetical protein
MDSSSLWRPSLCRSIDSSPWPALSLRSINMAPAPSPKITAKSRWRVARSNSRGSARSVPSSTRQSRHGMNPACASAPTTNTERMLASLVSSALASCRL